MTDNPLLTQPVQTRDGREAVVLGLRAFKNIEAAIKDTEGNWSIMVFDSQGRYGFCGRHANDLIPKPAVHPNLTGTRTFYACCAELYETDCFQTDQPRLAVTLTDGDPSSAVVEVVLPKGEG